MVTVFSSSMGHDIYRKPQFLWLKSRVGRDMFPCYESMTWECRTCHTGIYITKICRAYVNKKPQNDTLTFKLNC